MAALSIERRWWWLVHERGLTRFNAQREQACKVDISAMIANATVDHYVYSSSPPLQHRCQLCGPFAVLGISEPYKSEISPRLLRGNSAPSVVARPVIL